MKNNILTLSMCITLGVITLSSCGSDTSPQTTPLRTVKLETAGAENLAKTQFVASVRQEQRADLAFENGGRIAAINVDVGDKVRHEQVLARLDREPVRLKLQQAEATLRAATAQLHERQTQLNQQKAMFKEAMVSQAALTSAQVALDAAQADLHVAESNHALAKRALRQSELRAPFDGSVVARLLQPQADTAPGQTVLQIEGRGRLQAVATLPAEIAQALSPDKVIQGNRTDTPQASISLRLRSVSPRLESGASLQAIFDVTETTTPLHSGDTLLLALSATATPALSVPLPAVIPGLNGNSGIVFVYQPKTGVVLGRDVTLGMIEGERMQIRSGLKHGEQVVVAGAAFLSDGQKVLPFRSSSRLSTGDSR